MIPRYPHVCIPIFLVCAFLSTAAPAQDRIALVIGINHYQNFPADRQLTRAVNDARSIGNALTKLGFAVIRGENLDRRGMVEHIFAFTQRIKPGDIAVMFFAGHGIGISGGNYLLPTDIPSMRVGEESRARNMAIAEGDIIADIQERKARVAILILDACRDNPFRQPGMLRGVGGERGLMRGREAEGVFAIYSAGFNQTSLDNLGPGDPSPNSVFTRVLAQQIGRTDTHLSDIIIDIREEVARLAGSINHVQYPAYYDQTRGGRVYLGGRPTPKVPSDSRAAIDEEAAWSVVKDTVDITTLTRFVTQFPSSPRRALAEKRISALARAFGPGIHTRSVSERRVALVIGNSDYTNVPKLKNPKNDAKIVGKALQLAQFDVEIQTDLTREGITNALRSFTEKAQGADWTIVFFAGQGFLVDGMIFLIETDAKIAGRQDFGSQGIHLDEFLKAVQPGRQLRLVIADVCLDDPFASSANDSGFSKPAPIPPFGTLVFTSASPGQVASDGIEDHSPFALALTNRLGTPAMELSTFFTSVREDVFSATNQQQAPMLYGFAPPVKGFLRAPDETSTTP